MATKDDVHGIGSTTASPGPAGTTTDNELKQAVIPVPDPYERTPPHLMRVIARLFVATGVRLTEIAMLSRSTADLESHRVPNDGEGKPDFRGAGA